MHGVSTYLGSWLRAFVLSRFIASFSALFLILEPLAAQEPAEPQKETTDVFSLSLADLKRLSVVGASKREQPVAEAPSSITIIKADEVKKYGYRTLAEILASARGQHVSYDRKYSYLGMRGFNRGDFNSRMLLLVDGHRVNNNLSDGALIGTEFILDVDLIETVEIIRGPGSVLYGNNAFFGVINVRTKRGRDLNTGEISGEVARFDTYKGRVTYGNQFESGLEMLLSGSLYESQGNDRLFFKEFNSPLTSNGVARGADDDAFRSFFGTLTYRDFTLQGAFNKREKGVPTAPFFTAFNTDKTRIIDQRSYVDLSYAHEFPDVVDVSARIYYDRNDVTGDSFFDSPPPPVLNREVQVGEWWGAEVQANKQIFERHTLTLGADYRDDFRQERRNFDADPLSPILGRNRRDAQNYGVFLNSDFAIRTNLHLNAGARYDQYEDVDSTANPRVALIYNPFAKSTIKAIYGTAFRAPNFFERILESPSRRLQPETITTYELAYEQEIGDHLRSSVSGFYNEIENLITLRPDPAGAISYQNIEGATAKGVEFELEGTWESGLRGRVSYALQETEDRETGQRLTDSPKHLAKFNLSVPLPVFSEKVFASLEFQYTSKRLTLSGREANGFGIANFTLFSRELVKGLEASVSVYNLFDKRYGDPATPFHRQDILEQDGRNFRAKLAYRF